MSHNNINLLFSHSVEQLAIVLSEKISLQQAGSDIFAAPKVLVPNANMQRYLQLEMAKNNGVCAHVDFPFLETGLFQAVNQLLGSKFQHLNGSMAAWSVWSLLQDGQLINEAVYAPIKTYLGEQGSARLQATKRWQLSQKLAKLMLDYESQRPEMVNQWLQGKCVFNTSQNQHLIQLEQMQQDLYVRLFKATDNQTAVTLFQAAQWLDQIKQRPSQPAIHIFTPSRLSQLHRKLLVQLGQYMSLNIYSLNVCSEYWEDLQTEEETRWQQRVLSQYKQHPIAVVNAEGQPIDSTLKVGIDSTAELFSQLGGFDDENELLKAWGKPGREALKLFSDIEEDATHKAIAYQDDWLVPDLSANNSLLHVVQTHVLTRSAEQQHITDPKAFNSLQLACAPSIIREVEAVYNSILWNLNQNSDLALNEIAVLVSDMNAYRFVIEQVFEALNYQHDIRLSYAIVDSSAAKESRYAEAVLDLFTVLDDDFIRASVFDWLDNPCVQAGNHFDANDWQDWLLVVDHLGIYCGYSSLYPSDVANDADLEVDKLFTWQQGLARLHQSLAVLPMDDDSLDVSAIGAERVGQLSVLIETLYQYKIRLNQVQTASQWELQLNQMFDLLLAVPADEQNEQNIQMALQQSLLHLADAQPELKLSFEDIKQFISHEIQQLPASKGSYLSGGVVCAALQPMRPIPFKLTYILGLDEKTFPGQVRHETLDLTQRSRRIGDINTAENNNYLLLETLMCTREKLYLSYVGMDLLKDEVIEPSATFSTLYRYCESLIDFSVMEMDHLPIIQLPLDASESGHFDGKQLELQDWGINYSYSDYLLWTSQYVPDWQPIEQQLSPEQLRAWQKFQHTKLHEQVNNSPIMVQSGVSDPPLNKHNEIIHIDANELADYLANPQAAVLKHLGVNSKHPEDRSLLAHEPHQLAPLLKHEIFSDSIQLWLKQSETGGLTAIIKQQHQKHLARSQAPLALFAELSDLSKVEEDLDKRLKLELVNKQALGQLKMGNVSTQVAADKAVNGLLLTLDSGQQVQINGLTERLFQQGGYLTDQVVISSSKKSAAWNSKLLKPFVNWCLWQLSEQVQVAEVFKVHLVFPDKLQIIELQPWHADGASFATVSTIENYLKNLVTDFLEKPANFLPSEILHQLNIETKSETAQKVPFLKRKSTAKTINYLAYDQSDLIEEDIRSVVDNYLKAMSWPSYEEILRVVDVQPSLDPLADYRRHLLPLFAMVFGEFKDAGQGGKP